MSQYTKSTNFATKDNLTPGDPLKIVRGTEIDTEYNNIATAVATKTDNASAAITGGSITGITDLAIADGGTGASTATAALNNLLPSQTGNSSKYLQTDGTNATWDAISINTGDITGTLPVANGGTGITSFGTGIATFLGTPSSANLASAVTDETGSGALVFANTPTLVAPILGTPTSGNFSSGSFTWPTFNQNTTGTAAGLSATLAIASGGTGQTTANAAFNALAPSQTSASGKYLKSDGTNTSWDALDISTADITGTLPVANGGTGVTSSTGTGSVVLSNSPTLVTPILGTPQSGNFSTGTFTWPTFNQNTTGTAAGLSATLATTSGGTGLTSFTSGGVVYASSSSALATGSALTFAGGVFGINSASAYLSVTTTSGASYLGDAPSLISGSGASDSALRFDGSNLIFSASNLEKMRLTSGGNLGIGTSSPSAKLSITNSNATYSLSQNIFNASAGNLWIGQAPSATYFSVDNFAMAFCTGSDGGVAGTSVPTNERMRITSAGNVGIGTSSPISTQSGLDISSGGLSLIIGADNGSSTRTNANNKSGRFAMAHYTNAEEPFAIALCDVTSTTNELSLGGGSGACNTATVVKFFTAANNTTVSGSERARIDSSGNLLVGVTSSLLNTRLYVKGSSASSGDLNFLYTNSVGDTVLGAYNDGALYANSMKSGAGTNAVKFHTTTGQITYDTSSARYKDNIRNSIYGLSHVMQMRSAQFEYKDDGRSDVGLIAEELNPIIPELVGKNKHGEPDSVSYDRMVSVLVKAIQELKTEFDTYKASHP